MSKTKTIHWPEGFIPMSMRETMIKINTQEPLVCCEFKNLNRCVGFKTLHEFQGADGKTLIEYELEYPTVNTVTYGGKVPREEVQAEATKAHRHILDKLREIRDELDGHIRRLELHLLNDQAK
jgi:hypothetical protein